MRVKQEVALIQSDLQKAKTKIKEQREEIESLAKTEELLNDSTIMNAQYKQQVEELHSKLEVLSSEGNTRFFPSLFFASIIAFSHPCDSIKS